MPNKVYEWAFSRIYQTVFFKNKLSYENDAWQVFENGFVCQKLSFVKWCEKNDIEWTKMMEMMANEYVRI